MAPGSEPEEVRRAPRQYNLNGKRETQAILFVSYNLFVKGMAIAKELSLKR